MVRLITYYVVFDQALINPSNIMVLKNQKMEVNGKFPDFKIIKIVLIAVL